MLVYIHFTFPSPLTHAYRQHRSQHRNSGSTSRPRCTATRPSPQLPGYLDRSADCIFYRPIFTGKLLPRLLNVVPRYIYLITLLINWDSSLVHYIVHQYPCVLLFLLFVTLIYLLYKVCSQISFKLHLGPTSN